ncbi:MAG: MerR family transcriptional regulator [Acholeplasmataceae bacterium]|nr:MerR family transcriptional regulator [Acholeplasmataceae bacterium]
MGSYTITELADLANISTRTLRYYDQINLFKPARLSQSGSRIYEKNQIYQLQKIMFYKSLDIDLKIIKKLIDKTSTNELHTLKTQLQKMEDKELQIQSLIINLKQTIKSVEEHIDMKDVDRFKGFKEQKLNENDFLYQDEAIDTWGSEAYIQSKQSFSKMSEKEFSDFMKLGKKINEQLKRASDLNLDYQSRAMDDVARMHQNWITMAWGGYDAKAHLDLVNIYLKDERFKAYYDKEKEGLALLLKQSVEYMINKKG